MNPSADSTIPNRGKNAFRGNARAARKAAVPDSQPPSTQPSTVGISSLDNVRTVFWQAYRHLFPPHALAAQTGN